MAKSDKSSKTTEPVKASGLGMSTGTLAAIAAAVAVVVGSGVYAYRGGFNSEPAMVADADKPDPQMSELMQPGPLPDVAIGKADAPNVIVEYASMTCPHCAQFENEVFPKLKEKYIDTGQVRFIFREFPLDNLAARASMLARCAGPDRYFPMVQALFQTQEEWAGEEGEAAADKLLMMARQAGFSKDSFDKCMADKDLFNKIVQVRARGHDKFGVDSTPTFFINGKRLLGDHELKDFDAALAGGNAAKPADTAPPTP